MTEYRRHYVHGGTYFFTVNLVDRSSRLLVEHIDELREAFKSTQQEHPFTICAVVVLPDHLHAVWTLPDGDADFSTRWRKIKARFSRKLPDLESRSSSRRDKGERGIWQRRFWEHVIRDEADYQRHLDYVHYNPVKHGHCRRAIDWPHSSFRKFVRDGLYPANWAAGPGEMVEVGER